MEVLYPRCAGLDVHKDTVVAAVRLAVSGPPTRAVETFSTTTPGLMALSAWLDEQACTHVAMEATGIYWRPVWHVLSEEGRTLILANAAHVKNVPGRKTDVADAVWLSDLLAHGLIQASFVPEAQTQVMRTLLRTRKQLVREQAAHVQRIQKTLEEANIKLASVLTDIMGTSGRAVLDALVAGEHDPAALSGLVGTRVKAGRETIRAALTGRIGDPHRFLLGLHLRQYDALAGAVAEIDAQVERDLGPFRDAAGLLATIPGVSDLTAQVILSEIGPDMSRFPSAGHLISWAGLCPRNDESAAVCAEVARRLAHGEGRPSAAPPVSRRAPPGSRPPSSSAPGPPHARSRATSRLSSSACAIAADPRRPSVRSPPPSSLPPITCSRTGPSTSISAPITSGERRPRPEPRPSCAKSNASASPVPSRPSNQFLFRPVPGETRERER